MNKQIEILNQGETAYEGLEEIKKLGDRSIFAILGSDVMMAEKVDEIIDKVNILIRMENGRLNR